MIEVAEEFIEALHSRQVFVTVALVVLAELPGAGKPWPLSTVAMVMSDAFQPCRRRSFAAHSDR